MSSLEKCLFKSSAHFLNWVVFLLLSCMSCLYNLVMKALPVTLLANIFSHFIGFFFILFMLSFVVQKLVSFIGSYLILLLPWEID